MLVRTAASYMIHDFQKNSDFGVGVGVGVGGGGGGGGGGM